MILKANTSIFVLFLTSLLLIFKNVTGSTKCSAPIRVATGRNLLKSLSVGNEIECEDACERNLDCKFYTYYHKNSSPGSG